MGLDEFISNSCKNTNQNNGTCDQKKFPQYKNNFQISKAYHRQNDLTESTETTLDINLSNLFRSSIESSKDTSSDVNKFSSFKYLRPSKYSSNKDTGLNITKNNNSSSNSNGKYRIRN